MEWLSDFLKLIFNENVIPVGTGFIVGFIAGHVFSRYAWDYFVEGRRLRREDRAKEQARREAAAQRRLESMRRRAEERARVQKETEERARMEEEERTRMETKREFYRECARLGLMLEEDVCFSADGIAYCPECYGRKKIVELVKNRTRKALYCPECGFILDLSHEC